MLKKNLFFVVCLFWNQNLFADCLAEGDIKPNCCIGPSLCSEKPILYNCYKGWTCFLEGGFLYEQARITGTQIAYSFKLTTGADHDKQVSCVIRPNFNLNWGMTFGIGFLFSDDSWFLGARFDKLDLTSGLRRDSELYFPANFFWTFYGGAPQVNELVENYLNIDYYMLDVFLSRSSFFSGCFSLDPHIGIKAAWFYTKEDSLFEFVFHPWSFAREMQNKSWIVGPEVGIDLNWSLYDCISFFAESGLSLLWGQTKPQENDQFTLPPTIDFNVTDRESRDSVSPSLRLALGFKFDWFFWEDRFYAYTKVIFDSVVYWNQQERIINYSYGNLDNTSILFAGSQTLAQDNNNFSLMGLRFLVGVAF